jgi:hypothetical protein
MKKLMAVTIVLLAAACDSPAPRETPQIGTPERRAQDSVVAESKLPGAGAVGGSFGVDSAARARANMLDSIR